MHLAHAAAPATATATATAAASVTKADKQAVFDRISNLAQVELSVPSSPAFTILGINPDKVQRPGTIREFGASVLRGMGADGKAKEGLAFDVSTVALFGKEWLRGGSDYAPRVELGQLASDLRWEGYPTRVLARTTLSLAMTKPDPQGSARSAWGIRVGLIDDGDPGLYWNFTADCLRRAPTTPLPPGKDLTSKPADPSLAACNVLTNTQATPRPLWAMPALYVGYGHSWYSKTGTVTDRAPDARAAWLSFSIGHAALMPQLAAPDPNGLRVLLQAYASRRLDDRAVHPDDATLLVRQDVSEGTLRTRLGKDSWHGYLEFGHRRVRLGDNTTEKIRIAAVGGELKLDFMKDAWLQLAGVRERGFADGKDKNAMTVAVKLGVPFLEIPGSR